MWFDRVYFGDHKYINIMLLWWLEVIIPCKISENMYKYIYNTIDMLCGFKCIGSNIKGLNVL